MNLIAGILAQCLRVRELMPRYEEIGAPGAIALFMMRAAIAEAQGAVASGDVVRMVAAYKALEGFTE